MKREHPSRARSERIEDHDVSEAIVQFASLDLNRYGSATEKVSKIRDVNKKQKLTETETLFRTALDSDRFFKRKILEFLFAFNPICLDALEVCKTIYKKTGANVHMSFDVYMVYYKTGKDVESLNENVAQSIFVLPKTLETKLKYEKHDMYDETSTELSNRFGENLLYYDYLYTVYSKGSNYSASFENDLRLSIHNSKKKSEKMRFFLSLDKYEYQKFTIRHVVNDYNDDRNIETIFEQIFKIFDFYNDVYDFKDEYAPFEGSIITPLENVPNTFESLNAHFGRSDEFESNNLRVTALDRGSCYLFVQRRYSRQHILKIRNALVFFLKTKYHSMDVRDASNIKEFLKSACVELFKTVRGLISWNLFRNACLKERCCLNIVQNA